MSDFSVLEHQLFSGLHSVLTELVNGSSMDPATKAANQATLNNIGATLSAANASASNEAQTAVNTEAPTIEAAVGGVVETAADAAIATYVPASLAPEAEAAANALLAAVGGDVKAAMEHLFNIKSAA